MVKYVMLFFCTFMVKYVMLFFCTFISYQLKVDVLSMLNEKSYFLFPKKCNPLFCSVKMKPCTLYVAIKLKLLFIPYLITQIF